jgi:hypothetical protein
MMVLGMTVGRQSGRPNLLRLRRAAAPPFHSRGVGHRSSYRFRESSGPSLPSGRLARFTESGRSVPAGTRTAGHEVGIPNRLHHPVRLLQPIPKLRQPLP